MGRKRDLSDTEKSTIRVHLCQGLDTLAISKILHRDHRTIQRYVNAGVEGRKKYPKSGFKTVKGREIRKLKREMAKNPHRTSKSLFEAAGVATTPKTTRCRVLKTMGRVMKKSPKSPLTSNHREKRLEWARRYLKMDFSKVIFTDEARATLDGPDGWASGWVRNEDEAQTRIRRQQGGGGVMIWAGIISDQLVGPVRVPEGVKVNSEAYCDLLEDAFMPWFEKLSPNKQKSLIFQQDNAPAHSSKYTMEWLRNKGLGSNQIMVWPTNSADLNPIENLWSILKREVYKDGRQFTSKESLWEAIQEAAEAVLPSTVLKLTASMDSRVIEVIQKKGRHVKK